MAASVAVQIRERAKASVIGMLLADAACVSAQFQFDNERLDRPEKDAPLGSFSFFFLFSSFSCLLFQLLC